MLLKLIVNDPKILGIKLDQDWHEKAFIFLTLVIVGLILVSAVGWGLYFYFRSRA